MLTNEIRKLYGIKLLDPEWRALPIKGWEESYVLLDQKNIIQKFIIPFNKKDFYYREIDYLVQLTENDKILSKNGKTKPLSYSVLEKLKPDNKYFDVTENTLTLKNVSNGITLFDEGNLKWETVKDVQKFLINTAKNSNQFEKEELEEFLNTKKRLQKIGQGDIFRIKISQNKFAYGRVVADLKKFLLYDIGIVSEWKVDFRGRCIFNSMLWPQILVDFFLLITDNPYFKFEDLKRYKTTPSLIQSELMIKYGTYKIVDKSTIDINSFDVPMDLDTYYEYVPICHIFRWGATVVAFKPNKKIEKLTKLTYPINYDKYHSLNKKEYVPIEGFIETSIKGQTDFSYITDRGDLREELLSEMRQVISKNVDFDIDKGDYDSFAKNHGFMTKDAILEFTKS